MYDKKTKFPVFSFLFLSLFFMYKSGERFELLLKFWHFSDNNKYLANVYTAHAVFFRGSKKGYV